MDRSIRTRLAIVLAAIVAAGLGRSLQSARAGLDAANAQHEIAAKAAGPADDKDKAHDADRARPVVVPFRMLPTNHMLVEAKINGKGPYHLIFDLGAPITLLGNKVSEESGVVEAGAPRSFLFGMRGEAEIDRLEANGLTVTRLPVIVFDHPILGALGEMIDQRIDGIMGFTLFARYRTTIDYQAKRMTFVPVNYEVRDLMKELPERMLGPKVARERVLAPPGVWGIRLGKPEGGLNAPGVPVARVDDGSPAQRGGLRAGDVLTTLDGRWTTSIDDVFAAAADVEPGHATEVVVLRDGKEVTLTIAPGEGA